LTTAAADIEQTLNVPPASEATPEQEQQLLEHMAEQLETAPPQDILKWAVQRYQPSISLACSFGMQSVAIIDMLSRADLLHQVEVFYLDTGVLFEETHQTREKMEQRYGFNAVRVAPELTWEQQQEKYGGHLYERGPEGIRQCCHIRKVEPMKRYLMNKHAWITGMRRHHAKTRTELPVVMWDSANEMAKINPFAALDEDTLWGYIKAHEVPYNPLYDQGYASIGCNTPVCTQPVAEGEDARAGRWAGTGKVECGIHVDGKVIKSLDSAAL